VDGSTGARRASDLEVGDALVAHPWNEIAHSWHRRDNAALRSHLELVLTSGTAATAAPRSPAVADDPLRIWRRLSQAVFAGEHQPLRSLLRQLTDAEVAAEADWSALASLTIDHLAPDLVRPHGPDRQVARATLALNAAYGPWLAPTPAAAVLENSVRISPGWRMTTLIPNPLTSKRSASLIASTAYLDAW